MLTARFPRAALAHLPTPLEPMHALSRHLGGPALWVKRDDCTGLAMGGNKARQLEFYCGEAIARGADTLVTTGAVQSNHVRQTIAAARKLGLECEVQLEQRVPGQGQSYYDSGNVLLDKLMGAKIHAHPVGEDEAGAERAMAEIADAIRVRGGKPHIVSLAQDHEPVGALGYVAAAEELLAQARAISLEIDAIVLCTGSGSTHAGMLTGLRALGSKIAVHGICARRDRVAQHARVLERCERLARMLGQADAVSARDVLTDDSFLAPGYGLLSPPVVAAMGEVARLEGLLLDPAYTAKTMAGMMKLVRDGAFAADANVVFLHSGGTPALFAYPGAVQTIHEEALQQRGEGPVR
jgi:D-cysteine desulfhydrase/L-cysteate sulfo-lyase